MSLSVNDIFGKFIHRTPKPILCLDTSKAHEMTKFVTKSHGKKVRYASHKVSKNMKHMQSELARGLDIFADELSRLKNVSQDEAKQLLTHKHVTLSGMFNALP